MQHHHRIKSWYSNLRLHNKISLAMIIVLALLSVTFSAITTTFFTTRYAKESMIVAEQWLELSVRTVNHEIEAISEAIISSSVKPGFVSLAARSLASEQRELQLLVEAQTYLESIMRSSPLIAAAMVVDRNNHSYFTYDRIPKYNPTLVDFSFLNAQKSITALPALQSPFSLNTKVVPFIVPLKFLESSSYLTVASDQSADLVIAILLDESALYTKLNEAKSLFFRHINTLQFRGQNLLGIAEASAFEPEQSIYWRADTSLDGLTLVMTIERASFKPLLMTIILVSIFSALLIASLGSLVIMEIAQRTTRDFTTMTAMIEQIKEGRYNQEIQPRHDDETGSLIRGINEMHRTLLSQMERIKEEEQEKYRYLSQMLTEQINPHFIYNTLEIINMEVNKEQYGNASQMIQAFAAFLRYSLNQGEDTTSLDREVDHIRKYLMIMNIRLETRIILICDYPKALGEYRIPKSILMPLIENSIRHGFTSALVGAEVPAITIKARRRQGRITLTVADNGQGIDVEQASKALSEGPSDKGHVGLNNVYRRLELYYGQVSVNFSSIPGYRNEVTITLDEPRWPQIHTP